ncbi:MAG: DinB family protein [Gemmatimonadaceae bacterium]
MIDYLQRLGTHGAWADARLLAAARNASAEISTVLAELAHIRGAQETWIARVEGRSATLPVWPVMTLAELAQAGLRLDAHLHRLLGALTTADLERHVTYTNTSGREFRTPLGDILIHLLTHGQYHRGKANAALRAIGAAGIDVDFITWQRESPGLR